MTKERNKPIGRETEGTSRREQGRENKNKTQKNDTKPNQEQICGMHVHLYMGMYVLYVRMCGRIYVYTHPWSYARITVYLRSFTCVAERTAGRAHSKHPEWRKYCKPDAVGNALAFSYSRLEIFRTRLKSAIFCRL